MIPQEAIASAGGDWSLYGEISSQRLLDLINTGKISIVFADKAVIVGVQRSDGSTGFYNLPHVADLANFS